MFNSTINKAAVFYVLCAGCSYQAYGMEKDIEHKLTPTERGMIVAAIRKIKQTRNNSPLSLVILTPEDEEAVKPRARGTGVAVGSPEDVIGFEGDSV